MDYPVNTKFSDTDGGFLGIGPASDIWDELGTRTYSLALTPNLTETDWFDSDPDMQSPWIGFGYDNITFYEYNQTLNLTSTSDTQWKVNNPTVRWAYNDAGTDLYTDLTKTDSDTLLSIDFPGIGMPDNAFKAFVLEIM